MKGATMKLETKIKLIEQAYADAIKQSRKFNIQDSLVGNNLHGRSLGLLTALFFLSDTNEDIYNFEDDLLRKLKLK
jgi:hypothetical protein